jgi:hypothetical protein
MLLRHWPLVAIVLTIVVVVLPTMLLFDGLVEFEYDWHRDAWEADGRPTGYLFFRPPEARWFSVNTSVLFIAWLISTPSWARQNTSCLRSLRWMRVLTSVWVIGFLVVIYFSRQTS